MGQFLLDKTDYLLVFEDSNLGNSLATRVAAKLDLPYVGHVEEIESHPNSFTVKRHIGQTKAIRITPLQNSAVITVLFNGIMNNVEKAAVDIEHWQLATEDKNIYIKNEDSNNDLAYAKIVVAGGKGLQNAEGFQPLQELANKLNASLAATKAVTDQGPQQPNSEKPEVIENLFTFLRIVSSKDTYDYFNEKWNDCSIRYGDLKKQLVADISAFTAPIRERIMEYENNVDLLNKIALEGAEKSRESEKFHPL